MICLCDPQDLQPFGECNCNMTTKTQFKISKLERELTSQVELTNSLEREAAELRKQFDESDFNSKADFIAAKTLLQRIQNKQIQVRASAKQCELIRNQINILQTK